jgi:hypothetical protein
MRRHRRVWLPFGALALLPLAVSACGGDDGESWRDLALEEGTVRCERLYECLSAEELDALRPDMVQLGSSLEECRGNIAAGVGAQPAPCPSGMDWHRDKAQTCIAQVDAAACDNLRTDPTGPSCCREICTAAGD